MIKYKNDIDKHIANLPALKNQTQRLARIVGIDKNKFEKQVLEIRNKPIRAFDTENKNNTRAKQ